MNRSNRFPLRAPHSIGPGAQRAPNTSTQREQVDPFWLLGVRRRRYAPCRIESVSRGRKLTPQEAARYRQLRADIAREQPAIDAQIRAELAEQREWAAVFVELKQVRQSLGLSLEDIEARTGIDRSTVARLETGQPANFTLDMVRKYAQAVGKRALVTIADATS